MGGGCESERTGHAHIVRNECGAGTRYSRLTQESNFPGRANQIRAIPAAASAGGRGQASGHGEYVL